MLHHFNKLIAERNATEEKLEYLSHHDALTGFPNRLLVQSRFPHALAYAESQGLRVALLYLDLDNFKSINDSLGHAAGDEVIKLVALRLRECVNSTHMVSRLGGDEFLIVLRNVADTAEMENITKPLRRAVRVAQTVAGGDLSSTIEVDSKDETGELLQALKDMNDGLQKIVGAVRESTDTIATASGQIASGNLDLSSRTEEQAASLEETASSMEELTSAQPA